MKSENLWRIDIRQIFIHAHFEFLEGCASDAKIILTIGIVIFLSSTFGRKIGGQAFFQRTHQADPIPVISNTTSIVYLSYHIPNCIPVYLVSLGIQKHPQSADGHLQIRIIEFVPDIKPKRTILSSLLDKSMEECQTVQAF